MNEETYDSGPGQAIFVFSIASRLVAMARTQFPAQWVLGTLSPVVSMTNHHQLPRLRMRVVILPPSPEVFKAWPSTTHRGWFTFLRPGMEEFCTFQVDEKHRDLRFSRRWLWRRAVLYKSTDIWEKNILASSPGSKSKPSILLWSVTPYSPLRIYQRFGRT